MDSEHSPNPAPDRRIAFLIDADNISHTKLAAMLAELSKYGTANIRRAYGDWASTGLKGWKEKLHEFAIRPIQQFTYSTGKNATDMALVIDAMELLYTQKPDAFCIASSDADFTPLVMQLKANGHAVYGFGERKAPSPFVNACTTFLYLDALPELNGAEGLEQSTADGKSKSPDPEGAPVRDVAKPLSSDTKLVLALRNAVAVSVNDDGWALMSAVGSAAKRAASIEPRNHGYKNFVALYKAIGLFDVVKVAGGQIYVADKKTKDRKAKPTLAA